MQLPRDAVPIAAGRTADLYALDERWVLRRYRDSSYDVTREAATMRHARAHGVPVPEVRSADGPDMLLERLHGTTMVEALLAGDVEPRTAAATLVDLHRRVHAVDPVERGAEGDRLLHLDLHPLNVMLTPDGPMLIDWPNATGGAPGLDESTTAVILALVVLADTDGLRAGATALLEAFLAAADDPLTHLDDAVARRQADRNRTPAEAHLLELVPSLVRG